jgi:hypothetical protein
MVVKNAKDQDTFRIDNNGNVEVGGTLSIGPIGGQTVTEAIKDVEKTT